MRSVRSTATSGRRSISSAALPSEAARGLQPSCWRMRATESRLARSSSTTRTVGDIADEPVYRRVTPSPAAGLLEGRLCAGSARTHIAAAYSRIVSAVVFFPERRVPCESAVATSSLEHRSMSRLVPVPFLLALLALACDSSTPGPGQLRVANLIPDNVSLDVCLKPDTAGAYGSPLVGGSGLFYPQLSERSSFDAGSYSVRFVPAGSTGCAGSLNGLGDRSLTIAADFPQTLVLTGRLSGTGSPFVDVSVTQDRT